MNVELGLISSRERHVYLWASNNTIMLSEKSRVHVDEIDYERNHHVMSDALRLYILLAVVPAEMGLLLF